MDWCDLLLNSLKILSLRGSLQASQLSALDDAVFSHSMLCNVTNLS